MDQEAAGRDQCAGGPEVARASDAGDEEVCDPAGVAVGCEAVEVNGGAGDVGGQGAGQEAPGAGGTEAEQVAGFRFGMRSKVGQGGENVLHPAGSVGRVVGGKVGDIGVARRLAKGGVELPGEESVDRQDEVAVFQEVGDDGAGDTKIGQGGLALGMDDEGRGGSFPAGAGREQERRDAISVALPAEQEAPDDVRITFGTAHVPDGKRIRAVRRDGVFERSPHLFLEAEKGRAVLRAECVEPGLGASDEGAGQPAGV